MSEEKLQPQEIVEDPAPHPKGGFDLRVTIKNAKTGEILRHQPYDLHIVNGREYFERPCGSGNLYYASGDHAGRWTKDDTGQNYADERAPHKEFVAPKSNYVSPQAIAQENEALRAELAAIKAEKAAMLSAAEADVEIADAISPLS